MTESGQGAQNTTSTMRGKGTILITLSHDYLFWSSGLYFLLELSANYNVHVVLDPDLCRDPAILEKIFSIRNVTVSTLPSTQNPLIKHIKYFYSSKKLVQSIKPDFILQHHHRFPHNIYLSFWASILLPLCRSGVFLNAQLRKTSESKLSEDGVRKRFMHLPWPVNAIGLFLSRFARIFIRITLYYLIPKALCGKTFKIWPYLKRLSLGAIPPEEEYPTLQLVDFYLCYYPIEEAICRAFLKGMPIYTIQHPFEKYTREKKNSPQQNHLKEEKSILLLPSFLGFDSEINHAELLLQWKAVIATLQMKFPDYRLKLKLHPRSLHSHFSKEVEHVILETFPNLEIVDPRFSAESSIELTPIIVSDVSTTLWWANFLPEKLLLSFDLRSFLGSDDMRYYEGIYYCNDTKSLITFNVDEFRNARRSSLSKRSQLPTLTHVLHELNVKPYGSPCRET